MYMIIRHEYLKGMKNVADFRIIARLSSSRRGTCLNVLIEVFDPPRYHAGKQIF